MNLIRFVNAIVFCVLFLPTAALSDKLIDQRQVFLQAEKYLAEKKEADFLAVSSSLSDYPLYPYLRYQWLKDQLSNTDKVLAFLSAYKDTRYAALLRSKWLDYLTEQGRWQDFAQNYVEGENSTNDCQWQWAKYQTGRQPQALVEAKRLWLTGDKVAKSCDPLFNAFIKSATLTSEMTWQRFESALENNHFSIAQATATLFKQADKKQADAWLKLHQNPRFITDSSYWQEKSPQTGRLFAHTIKRLANTDLDKALALWDAKRADFPLANQVAQNVERKLGLALLGKKDTRAYSHLSKAAQTDAETKDATVRAALLEQNWQHVNSALALLTALERQQPKWQYWQARVWQETGKKQEANTLFSTVAKDRSFYGFMAADTVNKPYQVPDIPAKVSDAAVRQLADSPDFKAAQELKSLGRDIESRRQWQFAIKDLSKEKLLAAAKLAQQWHWDQLAITTLVKADYWDDMALRFPMNYLDEVKTNAEKHQIEAALIYGVMRQESMLDKNAFSSAGAMGLMQLMPDTAKKVAKELNEPWQSSVDLYKPEVNIRYGTYYFTDLLSQFNNHVAVASAAYNAGPSRAKKWLPAVTIPADIWIETIPFKETRKYVSSVLSYAMIYQERLKKKALRLKDLLKDIPTPKN